MGNAVYESIHTEAAIAVPATDPSAALHRWEAAIR